MSSEDPSSDDEDIKETRFELTVAKKKREIGRNVFFTDETTTENIYPNEKESESCIQKVTVMRGTQVRLPTLSDI